MAERAGFNPNTLKKIAVGSGVGLLATGLASCSGFDINRNAALATWEATQTEFAQRQMVESYHATQNAQPNEAASAATPDYATDPVVCEAVETTVSDAAVEARGKLPENKVKGRDLWVGLNRDGDLHFSTLEAMLKPHEDNEMDLAFPNDAVCVSLDYSALTDFMGDVFLVQPQK